MKVDIPFKRRNQTKAIYVSFSCDSLFFNCMSIYILLCSNLFVSLFCQSLKNRYLQLPFLINRRMIWWMILECPCDNLITFLSGSSVLLNRVGQNSTSLFGCKDIQIIRIGHLVSLIKGPVMLHLTLFLFFPLWFYCYLYFI